MAKKTTKKAAKKASRKKAAKKKAAAKPRAKASPKKTAADAYAAHRERTAKRQAELSKSGRDIGELPDIADRDRFEACRFDFRLFCETYFPGLFCLGWSEDHLRVIKLIEQVVLRGGQFAIAMPRGSGKTSLCEIAALWAVVYGHRRYVVLIGAKESHAEAMLDSIKSALEYNDELAADFPAACFPIAMLEGIYQRARGQLFRGKRTLITFTDNKVVLPTIPGSASSGAVLETCGLTGGIRGRKHTTSWGESLRPDLVIVDDPQTRESAHSPSQCDTREALVESDVLGLAGPKTSIAALMPCTVICEDDMADRVLDRTKHPEWRGERCKLVYEFPTRTDLWDEYAELLAAGFADADDSSATEFYLANREEMDRGARVAWPDRFPDDRVSAIQAAMDWKIVKPRSFWSEAQNEPKAVGAGDVEQLDADGICSRTNSLDRGVVPDRGDILTAFIDVQGKCLWWTVMAWSRRFDGWAVNYGAWPEQGRRSYYTLRDIRHTLAKRYPKARGLEGQLYAGLSELADELLGREWPVEGGDGVGKIDRLGVDANWGDSTDTVYQWCRETKHAALVIPTHGRYVGAKSKPMHETRAKGDRIGLGWKIPAKRGGRPIRHLTYDTNFWKSFLAGRLLLPQGDAGAVTLFGSKPAEHRMLADHLTSETRVLVKTNDREKEEWTPPPGGRDNHLLDCAVGCAVLASVCGAKPIEGRGAPRRQKLSDLQRRRRAA